VVFTERFFRRNRRRCESVRDRLTVGAGSRWAKRDVYPILLAVKC